MFLIYTETQIFLFQNNFPESCGIEKFYFYGYISSYMTRYSGACGKEETKPNVRKRKRSSRRGKADSGTQS